MQQLTHEGLLEGRPNSGLKVTRLPDAISELVVPIRQRVETFALRSFFDDIDDSDFRRWNEILEKMRLACVAGDFAAIAEQDIAFHRSIIRRASQRDLEAIWIPLVARVRFHFLETQHRDYSHPLEIHAEHVRIVEAFRGPDVEAAVRALEENIS